MAPIVFDSIDSVLQVFSNPQFEGNPNVKRLLDIYQKLLRLKKQRAENDESKYKHPFIVIEGLDVSGKGVLIEGLATKLKAETCGKVCEYILQMKDAFEDDELIRNAFYAMLNYIRALQASIMVYEMPVVIDKYWHYTTAFAIAKAVHDDPDMEKVPLIGDETYNWPSDLLKPDMILFLTVRERTRMKRYITMNSSNESKEVALKQDKEFIKNVLTVYYNIKGPVLESVDANLPKDYVLNEAIDKIKPFLPERLILSIMYGQ